MRVLVCGSRTFTDEATVTAVLDGIRITQDPWLEVIEGGAKGADRYGRNFAEDLSLPCHTFEADWGKHHKAAGPIRNAKMLAEGKPDLIVAFTDKPLRESRGTADMVRKAREAGVKVIHVEVVA